MRYDVRPRNWTCKLKGRATLGELTELRNASLQFMIYSLGRRQAAAFWNNIRRSTYDRQAVRARIAACGADARHIDHKPFRLIQWTRQPRSMGPRYSTPGTPPHAHCTGTVFAPVMISPYGPRPCVVRKLDSSTGPGTGITYGRTCARADSLAKYTAKCNGSKFN